MKPPKTTLVLIHDKTGKLESKQKSKTFMKENKNFVTRTTFQKKRVVTIFILRLAIGR